MKLLICGFYDHCNFGDDCFVRAFRQILPGHELHFVDLATVDKENLSEYHAVVVGGGDLINDFYGLKYSTTLKDYNGYKIAIGVGVSFEECVKREYLMSFDDIILRNKKDLVDISLVLGSKYTHYMPDLAFSLPVTPKPATETGNNVGVYLVGTMIDSPGLLYSVQRCINAILSNGYIVH